MDFFELVDKRRSVRKFSNETIPEQVIIKALNAAVLSANSSNLQPWEFYWVRDENKKNKLIDYCLGQPAAQTAQELIVCVARPDHWLRNRDLMIQDFQNKEKNIPKSVEIYYNKIVPLAYRQGFLGILGFLKKIAIFFMSFKKSIPREPTSFNDMKIWAHKTTALGCQTLMLALRAFGYDSCPMEGIDSYRIKKLLRLPKSAQITMVISAGKRAKNGVYGKRYRLHSDNFIKIV